MKDMPPPNEAVAKMAAKTSLSGKPGEEVLLCALSCKLCFVLSSLCGTEPKPPPIVTGGHAYPNAPGMQVLMVGNGHQYHNHD